ncbi:hypothetical protein AAFF_G00258940 [Aldrovandia affinis]|uniref:Uncharacterized protein n=1 Tax=Aldrovandia affinis TaxID=143900 RepID=A0AAD7WTJ2_9TELE|nr:hypothetical protein AAFF_G00258940 [Aldrovandia affinis]
MDPIEENASSQKLSKTKSKGGGTSSTRKKRERERTSPTPASNSCSQLQPEEPSLWSSGEKRIKALNPYTTYVAPPSPNVFYCYIIVYNN